MKMINNRGYTAEMQKFDIFGRMRVRAKQLLEYERDSRILISTPTTTGVNTLGNFPKKDVEEV